MTTVSEYVNALPPATRRQLKLLRALLRKIVPAADETIAYGIPTLRLNGNLVHFGGFKRHVGFYPGSSGIRAFKSELAAYKRAKGSVQFPLDTPLPVALITRIVRFRVKENHAKASKPSKK